ncbi:MAG: hypothetical protein HY329_00430, partial [Chloroflexi bacterium]|nr:hypothetical protein [Chloroflexota bacterium]
MRRLLPIICCVLVVGLFPLGSAGASWSRPAVPAAVAQTGVDVPVLSTTSCSLEVAVPLLRAFHGYFFVFRLASAGNVNLAWNLPQVQGAELALYGGYPFVDIYVPNPSLREPPAYPLLEASDVTDQLTLTSPELAPGLYTGYFYGLDDQSIGGTTAQVTLLGSGCAPLARPQPTATATPIPPTASPIGLPTATTPPALGTPVATATPGSGSGGLLCRPAASAG